jgi:hypothetical protein
MWHQSKTKVSSEHRAHNEPKNLSPNIMKEGLSLLLSTNVLSKRSSEERPQNYRVQESYANQDLINFSLN